MQINNHDVFSVPASILDAEGSIPTNLGDILNSILT